MRGVEVKGQNHTSDRFTLGKVTMGQETEWASEAFRPFWRRKKIFFCTGIRTLKAFICFRYGRVFYDVVHVRCGLLELRK